MNTSYAIVICTYNGCKHIRSLLESILHQVDRDVEIIISDDGSQDSTKGQITEVMREHSFVNYSILDGPRSTISENFFHALKYVKSDYAFICDQDDVWKSKKIDMYKAYFDRKIKDPHLIFSDACVVDDKLHVLHESFMEYEGISPDLLTDDSLTVKNCVQGATCCINKSLIQEILNVERSFGFDDIIMHDWFIALLAKYKGHYDFIDEPTLLYRQHDNNVVGARRSCPNGLFYRYITHPLKYTLSVIMIFKQLKKINIIFGGLVGRDFKHIEPLRRNFARLCMAIITKRNG